jgi:dipicolinate synthase subunit A
MNSSKWCVIGTDPRMAKLASELKEIGEDVLYVKSKAWGFQLERSILDFKPEKIVFPIQPLELAVPQINQEIFDNMPTCFVGRLTSEWSQLLSDMKCPVHKYLENEEFIWLNAKLTAEGYIAAFYLHEKQTIAGKKFVLAGFGRVSKLLAAQLKKMDAFPLIVVRSLDQLAEAKAMGYEAEILSPGINCANVFFINTIPATWLTDDYVKKISMVKTFYDIASAPGCLNCKEPLMVPYHLYTSLPGQFIENDAASLLSSCIQRLSKQSEGGSMC